MLTWLIVGAIGIFTVWFFFLRSRGRSSNQTQPSKAQQSKTQPNENNRATPTISKAPSTPVPSTKKEIIRELPNLSSTGDEFSFAPTSFALPTMTILYGTQKGTAERFAKELGEEANRKGWSNVEVQDVENYDFDSLSSEEIIIFIVATYIEGTPTDSTKSFYNLLQEECQDIRAGSILHSVSFAVFGLCNSLYTEHYNTVGKNCDKWFMKLGGKRLVRLGEGDENSDQDKAFTLWRERLWKVLEKKERQLREAFENPDLKGITMVTYSSDEESNDKEPLVDIEDIGASVAKVKRPPKKSQKQQNRDEEACDSDSDDDDGSDFDPSKPLTEMLSSTHKKSLQKQGYKIIGGHSGVKLCRWTKSMLRGRGGCYKHTFYGIASHRCMEMTPSMACANKCVFCWRHHKNPVTREWRWFVDDPEMLVTEAVDRHQKMIKTCRGIPGVIPERFEEGLNVRHCALSLVGEPIIYPEINRFIKLLHDKRISSFMVTNAQFPEKIENLVPVTQLYVSIDAPTEESLKKIDRPLFHDFWQRFIDCLQALSRKGQRTVYRLTLVKDWNMDEIDQYANLIAIGKPDFIEVKGVTFAGGGKKNQLSMSNVPWHTEVIKFCEQLSIALQNHPEKDNLPNYELASEHEHSCCILLANVQKFKVNNVWHTWIDFDKFLELQNSGEEFTSEQYMCPTPEWAVYGHEQRGFDPEEFRFKKVRNHIKKENPPAEESYVNGGC